MDLFNETSVGHHLHLVCTYRQQDVTTCYNRPIGRFACTTHCFILEIPKLQGIGYLCNQQLIYFISLTNNRSAEHVASKTIALGKISLKTPRVLGIIGQGTVRGFRLPPPWPPCPLLEYIIPILCTYFCCFVHQLDVLKLLSLSLSLPARQSVRNKPLRLSPRCIPKRRSVSLIHHTLLSRPHGARPLLLSSLWIITVFFIMLEVEGRDSRHFLCDHLVPVIIFPDSVNF